MRFGLPAALLLLTGVMVQAGEKREPFRIYLHGRQDLQPMGEDEKKELAKQLKDAADSARDARKSLEKELKSQHGKKRDKWPEEARARYDEAEKTVETSRNEWWYGTNTPESIEGSLGDLTDSLPKKKLVTMVASPESADFVLELRGRTIVRGPPKLLVRMSAGGQLDGARLVDLEGATPPGKGWAGSINDDYFRHLNEYSAQTPYWDVEFTSTSGTLGRAWRNAAASMAGLLERFLKGNYDALVAMRRSE